MLKKLQFRPGIVRDATSYSSEGGWYDADKVRFRIVSAQDGTKFSVPEKLGGWQRLGSATLKGTCRALHQWTALDLNVFTGAGTAWKLYVLDSAGTSYDITPIRATATLGSNPFATVAAGTGQLLVHHVAHGATANDFVTFSAATGFDNYTAGSLNTEFQVTDVVDVDNYHITVSGITSAAGSVTGGGASVSASYQINVGLDAQIGGSGWGSGTWGRGGWGTSYSAAVATGQVRIWSMDNFGEDLYAAPLYGSIYWWQRSSGTSARAVLLSSVAGANYVPTITEFLAVTDERYIIAFGCNQFGQTSQDFLAIRWCSQENPLEWEPRTDTTAGGLRLGDGSFIAAILKAPQGTLIWTDKSIN